MDIYELDNYMHDLLSKRENFNSDDIDVSAFTFN